MTRTSLLLLLLSAFCLRGAFAAGAPSDPGLLSKNLGKSAAHLTFQPIDGALRSFVTPGKPTVVVAFASWCAGCVEELPRTLHDYEQLKSRVSFLGVDYLDSPQRGRAFVQQHHIPFPVEQFASDANAPTLATEPIVLPSKISPRMLRGIAESLPVSSMVRVKAALAAKSHMTHAQFIAYENTHGIFLGDQPKHPWNPPAPPSGSMLGLPDVFVIDASGVVRSENQGYSPQTDPIRAGLAKIGVR